MNHFDPEKVSDIVRRIWMDCVERRDFAVAAWCLCHTTPDNTDLEAIHEQAKNTTIDKSKIANALSTMESFAIAFREDSLFVITLAFAAKLTSRKSAVQAMVEQMALYCLSLHENGMLKTIQSIGSLFDRIAFVAKFMKKLEDINNSKDDQAN